MPSASIPSGTVAEPSPVPVASSPIAAQAYSRRDRRLSPSLANRLRIGFAIGFAVLTAMAVIGVGRFIQQRQDFEDEIARSYQVEMAARVRVAEGQNACRVSSRGRRTGRPPDRTARPDLLRQPRHRPARRRRLDRRPDRRPAALQRPDRLDAAAAGGAGRGLGTAGRRRPQRPGRGRRALGDGDPGRRLQRDGGRAGAGGEPARSARPAQRRVRPHRLARAAQPAHLGPGLRRAADAGARQPHPASRRRRSRSSSTTAATWSAC